MGYIKEIVLPFQNPPFSVCSLASRAMSVAAAIVMQLSLTAAIAGLPVSSQGGSSACPKGA